MSAADDPRATGSEVKVWTPHATLGGDRLYCVHGVTEPGTATSNRCRWWVKPNGRDPVGLWARHGAAAHNLHGELRWDEAQQSVISVSSTCSAAPVAEGPGNELAAAWLTEAEAEQEAVEWFRRRDRYGTDPEDWIADGGDGQRHAATIVRAVLARPDMGLLDMDRDGAVEAGVRLAVPPEPGLELQEVVALAIGGAIGHLESLGYPVVLGAASTAAVLARPAAGRDLTVACDFSGGPFADCTLAVPRSELPGVLVTDVGDSRSAYVCIERNGETVYRYAGEASAGEWEHCPRVPADVHVEEHARPAVARTDGQPPAETLREAVGRYVDYGPPGPWRSRLNEALIRDQRADVSAGPADGTAAPALVVGKAGVPIDAYDAIQILATRPDHPSRLLAEKARAVADWVNDPPFGILQREQLEEVAPDLVEKLFDLLGGGPGDVSDVRAAGHPVRDSQPEGTDG